jgi:outer membrane protein assembly factor BamB
MRRRAVLWVGSIATLVLLVAVVVLIHDRPLPVARGRATDACPARGPGGLVGLDLQSGRVRWTNVVGDDVADLWAPAAAGSGPARAFVLGSDGSVRRVVAATGDVDRCPPAASLRPSDGRVPIPLDRSGAVARHQAEGGGRLGVVEVVGSDGSVRWRARSRTLVGSARGTVVVRSDEGDDCCAETPDLSVEAREPDTGRVRWRRVLRGSSAVVGERHLVVVDQFDGRRLPPRFDDPLPPVRVTAYDLVDGHEAWRVRSDGFASEAFAGGGSVLVPIAVEGSAHLVAYDEASGRRRWTTELPEPGRGGDDTELGAVPEVAVAGRTVLAVVWSTHPYRD